MSGRGRCQPLPSTRSERDPRHAKARELRGEHPLESRGHEANPFWRFFLLRGETLFRNFKVGAPAVHSALLGMPRLGWTSSSALRSKACLSDVGMECRNFIFRNWSRVPRKLKTDSALGFRRSGIGANGIYRFGLVACL